MRKENVDLAMTRTSGCLRHQLLQFRHLTHAAQVTGEVCTSMEEPIWGVGNSGSGIAYSGENSMHILDLLQIDLPIIQAPHGRRLHT